MENSFKLTVGQLHSILEETGLIGERIQITWADDASVVVTAPVASIAATRIAQYLADFSLMSIEQREIVIAMAVAHRSENCDNSGEILTDALRSGRVGFEHFSDWELVEDMLSGETFYSLDAAAFMLGRTTEALAGPLSSLVIKDDLAAIVSTYDLTNFLLALREHGLSAATAAEALRRQNVQQGAF